MPHYIFSSIKSNNFNGDILAAKSKEKQIHFSASMSIIIRNLIGKTHLIRFQSILDANVLIPKLPQFIIIIIVNRKLLAANSDNLGVKHDKIYSRKLKL